MQLLTALGADLTVYEHKPLIYDELCFAPGADCRREFEQRIQLYKFRINSYFFPFSFFPTLQT